MERALVTDLDSESRWDENLCSSGEFTSWNIVKSTKFVIATGNDAWIRLWNDEKNIVIQNGHLITSSGSGDYYAPKRHRIRPDQKHIDHLWLHTGAANYWWLFQVCELSAQVEQASLQTSYYIQRGNKIRCGRSQIVMHLKEYRACTVSVWPVSGILPLESVKKAWPCGWAWSLANAIGNVSVSQW